MHKYIHVRTYDGCSVCAVDYAEFETFYWNEENETPMCENCAISSQEGNA